MGMIFFVPNVFPKMFPIALYFFISYVLAKVEVLYIHKYYKGEPNGSTSQLLSILGSAQYFKKLDNEPIKVTPPLQINKYRNFVCTLK